MPPLVGSTVASHSGAVAEHNRHTPEEQPTLGGASGQQGVRPYGEGSRSSKVRWMALSVPQTVCSPNLKPKKLHENNDLEAGLLPVAKYAGDGSFELTLQNVTAGLEELRAAHCKEISNLRAEKMSLYSQLHHNQDSAPDADGHVAHMDSSRDAQNEPSLKMGESEGYKLCDDEGQEEDPDQLSQSRAPADERASERSADSLGFNRGSVPKKTESKLIRSQSQSQFPMSFDLRRAWTQNIDEWAEEVTPMPSMKISAVGSRVASLLRNDRQMVYNNERGRRPLILHPHGGVRMSWNMLCLLAICYDIVFVPLEAFDLEAHILMDIVEWFLTILWTADMLVTLRTAYFVGSTLETSSITIALNYAKTWLFLDLTIITMEWLARLSDAATGFGSILRTSRVFRTLRCVRLLRLGKLKGLLSVVEDQINSGLASLVFSLLKLVMFLVVMVHAITCVWYAVGDSSADGWVSYYAPTFTGHKGFFYWYFASSRWTLAQINGRTDMDERRNVIELGVTCIVAVGFAVVFMALFISSITTTMMELSSIAENKFNTQRMVGEYMADNYVSARLVGSVKRHIKELQGVEDTAAKEIKILAMLPRQMANDLLYEVRSPTLSRNGFFENLNMDFPRVVRHVCHKAVSVVTAHRWEVVFDKGDACSRMLFVDKGEIMYSEGFIKWQPDFRDLDIGPPGEALRRGAWVSEAALWIEWRNQGKLTAAAHSSLLALESSDFAVVMQEYKDAYTRAVLYAGKFVQELMKLEKVSDMISTEKNNPYEEGPMAAGRAILGRRVSRAAPSEEI